MPQVLQMDGEGPFDDLEGNAAFGRLFQKFLALNGVNASSGTVVVNGTTPVVVADANFSADSIVTFSLKTVGGTVGAIPKLATVTPGTGFTVTATASDTSTYNYVIQNP